MWSSWLSRSVHIADQANWARIGFEVDSPAIGFSPWSSVGVTSEGKRPDGRCSRTLWAAADEMRANSSLAPAEYRGPVLGLIFLAYAEQRFDEVTPELEGKHEQTSRPITPDDYRSRAVLYVPDEARLSHLVALPESQNLGKAIDDAMKAIEAANSELRDVLPAWLSADRQVHTQRVAPAFRTTSTAAVRRCLRIDLRGLLVQLRGKRGPPGR